MQCRLCQFPLTKAVPLAISRCSSSAVEHLLVGVEHDGVVEQLRQQLKQAELPVFALAQSKPSLDDVYLQATGRTLMDAELAIAGQRDPKAERKQAMR